MEARTMEFIRFGKGFYIIELHFQGGDCGFFCRIMGQFHCITYGPPDFPVLLLHVLVLYQPSMGRLSLYVKPVKLFSHY